MRAMSAKLPDGIARFILCIKEDNNMRGRRWMEVRSSDF